MPRGRCSAGGGALLLLAMTTAVMMATTMAHAHSQETHELLEEDTTSTEELTTADLSRVSPLSSWLIFRRNSNKGDNRRSKTSRSRSSKHGLPGPPGPPGPQGPPGPPGPPLPPQQELIQELRELAAAEGACLLCGPPPPPLLRVATSFLSRLAKPLTVPRRSLLELLPFSKPSASERSLQRGQSFNSSSGRYTAPLAGFYQLTASLLMESGDRVQVRLRDSVRAAICIESLCQSNVSVESVMGMAAAGGTFSILLTGTLYLQAGAYVSIFVDNGSGSAVTVLQDSLFSGILLGV